MESVIFVRVGFQSSVGNEFLFIDIIWND